MKITKKNLIDIIDEISTSIDAVKAKLKKQESVLENLRLENEKLKQDNCDVLDQIKEYVVELEKIRKHYVNNNNNISG